jgi:hypothetical protein
MSDSEAEIIPVNADFALANEVIGKRKHPKTVNTYLKSMQTFGRWLTANDHSAHVDAVGLPSLPLDHGLTITFFGALVQPRLADHSVFGKPRKKLLENGGHLSHSTISGFKSAVAWLHEEKQAVINAALDKELNHFVLGYRKDVAIKKQNGVMNPFEGKQALAFVGYKMLARRFMQMTPAPTSGTNGPRTNHRGDGQAITWNMGTFGWGFLLMQWNLLARFVPQTVIPIHSHSLSVTPQVDLGRCHKARARVVER